MNRWKASATHLVLSAVVIGGIAISAFLLWYPYGLHRVSGLDRILLVMLGIDLTAGPLLTLIVYKREKPSLRFDLAVIALCQVTFLGYGLHTLWQGRPVFLVGTPEIFTLVFANEIDAADLAQASRPEWRRLSWTGPQLVGTRMPDDPSARREVLEAFMAGGAGIERSPVYYRPYTDIAPLLLRSATSAPPTEPAPGSPGNADKASKLRQVPIVSRRGEGVMQLDAAGMPERTFLPPL